MLQAARRRLVSVGSALYGYLDSQGSLALSYFLEHCAGYDATYGSFGAAIGLMMWMWMSTIVVLFGAELNLELEHQTAKDSTDGRTNQWEREARRWPIRSVSHGNGRSLVEVGLVHEERGQSRLTTQRGVGRIRSMFGNVPRRFAMAVTEPHHRYRR